MQMKVQLTSFVDNATLHIHQKSIKLNTKEPLMDSTEKTLLRKMT